MRLVWVTSILLTVLVLSGVSFYVLDLSNSYSRLQVVEVSRPYENDDRPPAQQSVVFDTLPSEAPSIVKAIVTSGEFVDNGAVIVPDAPQPALPATKAPQPSNPPASVKETQSESHTAGSKTLEVYELIAEKEMLQIAAVLNRANKSDSREAMEGANVEDANVHDVNVHVVPSAAVVHGNISESGRNVTHVSTNDVDKKASSDALTSAKRSVSVKDKSNSVTVAQLNQSENRPKKATPAKAAKKPKPSMNKELEDARRIALITSFHTPKLEAYSEGDDENITFNPEELDTVIAIIVNPSNTEQITKKALKKIYTDNINHWKNGERILPFNLPVDTKAREIFSRRILKMSAIEAATAESNRMMQNPIKNFSETKSGSLVLSYVARNPNAIGYVPLSLAKDNPDVKVVLTVNH